MPPRNNRVQAPPQVTAQPPRHQQQQPQAQAQQPQHQLQQQPQGSGYPHHHHHMVQNSGPPMHLHSFHRPYSGNNKVGGGNTPISSNNGNYNAPGGEMSGGRGGGGPPPNSNSGTGYNHQGHGAPNNWSGMNQGNHSSSAPYNDYGPPYGGGGPGNNNSGGGQPPILPPPPPQHGYYNEGMHDNYQPQQQTMPPHSQQQQQQPPHQPSPYPQTPGQQQQHQGSGGRGQRTPLPSPNNSMDLQQQQQQQQGYYGNQMPPHQSGPVYGNQGGSGMRGSAPPPHMEPSPSFMQNMPSQPMHGDRSPYGKEMSNSPPPMSNPPQQHQQQGSYAPHQQPQQQQRGYNYNSGQQMPPPPPHHQQQSGNGGRGMSPSNNTNSSHNNSGMMPPPHHMGNNPNYYGGPNSGNMYMQQPPHPQQVPMNVPGPMQQQDRGMMTGGSGMNSNNSSAMRGNNNSNNNRMDWNAPPPPPQNSYGPPHPIPNGGNQRGPGPVMMNAPLPSPEQQQQQRGGGGGGMLIPPMNIAGPPRPPMHMRGNSGPPVGQVPPDFYVQQQQQQRQPATIPIEPPTIDIEPEPRENLNQFLQSRELFKTAPLSCFFRDNYNPETEKPYKIAIDANHMIAHLQTKLQQLDPLWFLHSPLPDLLTVLVSQSVMDMRALNLEPMWVFTGMGISGDVETFIATMEELDARDAVWQKLTEGELPLPSEVSAAFETFTTTREDVLMVVQRFLRTQLNVSAVTAPFLSWCQMIAFHAEEEVQLLMGPPEMLMLPYEGMHVIVDINPEDKTVTYYDRDEVLRTLFPHYVLGDQTEAAGERLLDLGLLTSSHPALSSARANVTVSTAALYNELSAASPQFPTFSSFLDSFECTDMNHDEGERRGLAGIKHAKGRCFVHYSSVFSKQFPDSPMVYFMRVLRPNLTDKDVSTNISTVFGNVVPLSLFFFQLTGLLSVSLMTIVTQAYFRDELPVSDSMDFRHQLRNLVSLRGQTVYQLITSIDCEAYQQRMEFLSWVRWYDEILTQVSKPISVIHLDEWRIDLDERFANLDDSYMGEISIATVLSLDAHTMCVPTDEISPNSAGSVVLYHGRTQTLLAVLLKAFDFLGYFSHPDRNSEDGDTEVENMNGDGDGGNSILANGVGTSPNMGEHVNKEAAFTAILCRSLENSPLDFQSGLLCLMELVRLSVLHSFPCHYIPTSIEGPGIMGMGVEQVTEMDEDNMDEGHPDVLLATRIACMVSIPYSKDFHSDNLTFEWAPVYSRYLCSFSVIVRETIRHLRELMEVMSACVFLGNHSDCTLSDFSTFAQYLPFGEVPSTIGGLLLHYVLVFPSDYENNCQTPLQRCEHLQQKFKDIEDVPTQLRRVMEFTIQGLYMVRAYYQNALIAGENNPEKIKEFIMHTDSALEQLREKWELHLDGEPLMEEEFQ